MQYCSVQHRTLLPSLVTSTTGCCFCFGSVSSFFPELFLHWSPVVYWGVPLSVSYLFAFSYCLWGSQGKNPEVVCHSLLQWTLFCENSFPWPVHFLWTYMAWLLVSLNYRRLWSMWSFWLVFCDGGSLWAMVLKFLFLLSALWWMRIRDLCRIPDGRDWLWGKLLLALVGTSMISKFYSNFLLTVGSMLLPCNLAWCGPVLESAVFSRLQGLW